MNAALESLNELHKRLLAEAEEQDGLGMAEVLAGNIVKENMQRGVAAGLRMAAGLVTEEIENQEVCEKVDAMTPAEVDAYLVSMGMDLAVVDQRGELLKARMATFLKANTKLRNASQ